VQRGSKRRWPRYSTDWGQPVEGGASLERGGSTMEGTSGAAERALLRGRTREAALSDGPRQRILRRPRRESVARQASSPRDVTKVTQSHGAPETPTGARASLRHEVSEPIGLGRSFHRERSWWEKPRLEANRLGSRPLARDLSAGSARDPAQAGTRTLPSAARRPRDAGRFLTDAHGAGDRRENSSTPGRPRAGCCGARTTVVVLVKRNDCRSRQAAFGPARPRAKSRGSRARV
jgi:hypothetical protein